MKNLLINLSAIVLLSISSFSFAASDTVKGLAFNQLCYGAYINTGQPEKAEKRMDMIELYADYVNERDIAESKAMVTDLIKQAKRAGMGPVDIAKHCDKF